jgi:hypothetical protein
VLEVLQKLDLGKKLLQYQQIIPIRTVDFYRGSFFYQMAWFLGENGNGPFILNRMGTLL